MMAALLAAALWLNVATAIGAPVSTTHAIVGAIVGGGIAASGMDIVNWGKMGQIAASWVISPILGGLVAAGLLYLIKRSIIYQTDMVTAAQTIVPWLVAFMGWTFGTYIMLKGLNHVWKVSFIQASFAGTVLAIIFFVFAKYRLARLSTQMNNNKDSVNQLFTIPLIFAAALLSFAHGSSGSLSSEKPLASSRPLMKNSKRSVRKGSASLLRASGETSAG